MTVVVVCLTLVCALSIFLSGYLGYKIVVLADSAQDRLSEALLEASRLLHAKTLHEYAQAKEIAAESDLRVRALEDALHDKNLPTEEDALEAPNLVTLASGKSINLNDYLHIG